MPLKPLKSLLKPVEEDPPLLDRSAPNFQGRTHIERLSQTACAWFVWQRAAFAGALTPLFARPGDQPVELNAENAIKAVAEAVGLGMASIKYVPLSPFYSYSLFSRAMAMRHCSLEKVMEFEWDELDFIQEQRRKMTPEAEVLRELVERLAIPPQMARMLSQVALEATSLVAHRTIEHARAVDTEVYRQLGRDATLTGDSRAALAAQRALTVTQGTAKSTGGAPLTLDQIFKTMRELDNEPPLLSFTKDDEDEPATD